jgi:hypothetical protein
VYTARTNWQAAYKKKDEQYQAARAAADTNAAAARDAEALAKDFEAQATKRLDDEKKERDDLKEKLAAKVDELHKANVIVADSVRETHKYEEALSRLQKERQLMEETLAKRDEQLTATVKDLNKANHDANSFRIERDALILRMKDTVAQIKDLERVIKEKGGTAVAVGGRPVPNPPPGNVEGLITKIDDRGEYLAISIGQDSGIEKNHTLDVYGMRGDKPQYLGTIRVLEVRPKEAVARPEKLYGQVKPGDSVGVIGHGG